jgi:SOS response regulatory protein OraA/RecX
VRRARDPKKRPIKPELSPEENLARERAYVFWLLASRDYSRKKLETKLKARRSLNPSQIKELLDSLAEQKIFQPANFTKARTRSLARKGYSSSGISYRLREDGISESATQVDALLNDQGIELDAGLKLLVEKERRKSSAAEISKSFIRRCLTRGHRYADILKAWNSSAGE